MDLKRLFLFLFRGKGGGGGGEGGRSETIQGAWGMLYCKGLSVNKHERALPLKHSFASMD